MKLIIDMNLPRGLAAFLDEHGLQARHWSTIGPADASDSEILAFAARDDAVVVTCDLDFSTILAASEQVRPSVVQIRGADLNAATLGGRLLVALTAAAEALSSGALVTIAPAGTRVRILPLSKTGAPAP